MSISSVREAFNVFKRESSDDSWLDESELDLISALAQYILKNSPKPTSEMLPKGYISIYEFESKYKFVAWKTLSRYCRNEEFVSNCAILYQHKWYVHPERTVDYLTSVSAPLKKRWERIFKENVSQ